MADPIDWDKDRSGGNSAYIGVRQVVPNLRILGMFDRDGFHEVIDRIEYRGEYHLGGVVDRQRYLVRLRSGKSLPMTGTSKIHVLKPLEPGQAHPGLASST